MLLEESLQGDNGGRGELGEGNVFAVENKELGNKLVGLLGYALEEGLGVEVLFGGADGDGEIEGCGGCGVGLALEERCGEGCEESGEEGNVDAGGEGKAEEGSVELEM